MGSLTVRPRYASNTWSGFVEFVLENTTRASGPTTTGTFSAQWRDGSTASFTADSGTATHNTSFVLNTLCLPDGPCSVAVTIVDESDTAEFSGEVVIRNGHGSAATRLRSQLKDEFPSFFCGPIDATLFDDHDPDMELATSATRPSGPLSPEHLRQFEDEGFTIAQGLLPESLCAEASDLLADIDVHERYGHVRGSSKRIERLHVAEPVISTVFRSRVLLEAVAQLLGDVVVPAQTLTFIYGSTQSMHQDTIHLSNFPSGQMCGVWIALEDIRAGSGELAYYRGSHRWPRIFMRDLGLDKIDPAQPDWATFGGAYRTATQRLEAEHAVSAESFLARRGDVLFWHENLMHQGTRRVDPDLSRHSMVIHYFTLGCLAWYDSSGTAAFKDCSVLD